jgi:lipopolysaccharide transport system ATP-binding protein
MKKEIVIRIENLNKKFRIPHEKAHTLFEAITHIFRRKSYETFYALKNINISIKKGEFIGLIGENGSGKSTLLRMMSRIIEPTKGKIYSKGKIVSFIELGVGFQMELTAKENVYLYGAVMGMKKNEITRKFDAILEFANVKKFRDTKLKNFSSGMIVRLAFATAIQTKPDILLLDEVLAVGDAEFQKKCFKVFEELKRKGTTIIFASHDFNAIKKFCNRTLYLKKGNQILFDKTEKVLMRYSR